MSENQDKLRHSHFEIFDPMFDIIGEAVVTLRDIFGHFTSKKCSRKKIFRRK